ncbi:MAG: DNA cytosine methyltransferase [Solirubrobacterales bacterium]
MSGQKPRLLDLFCGAGGAAMGYHRAGFEVVGVDIKPQPHYPFEFHQADALEFLDQQMYPLVHGQRSASIAFDAIHASPPCQLYSPLKSKTTKDWPDLVAPTRELLNAAGFPYVIENVMPAPMHHGVVLCGSMFGLRTHRHRTFEASWLMLQPTLHDGPTPRTSTKNRVADLAAGLFLSVTGNIGVHAGPVTMGIDWMNGDELSQAIPPAYTEWIGLQLMKYIRADTLAEEAR